MKLYSNYALWNSNHLYSKAGNYKNTEKKEKIIWIAYLEFLRLLISTDTNWCILFQVIIQEQFAY